MLVIHVMTQEKCFASSYINMGLLSEKIKLIKWDLCKKEGKTFKQPAY